MNVNSTFLGKIGVIESALKQLKDNVKHRSYVIEFISQYGERAKKYDPTFISYILNFNPIHCSLPYNSMFASVPATHTSNLACNIFSNSIQSGKKFVTEVSLSTAKLHVKACRSWDGSLRNRIGTSKQFL